MNLAQAVEFIHRYGNVGRNADELLKEKPNPIQLIMAKGMCQRALDKAFEIVMEYHGIKEEPQE